MRAGGGSVKKRMLLFAVLPVLAAVILLGACSRGEAEVTAFIMDTTAVIKVEGGEAQSTAEQIADAAASLEKMCLSRTVPGSDVFSLNSAGEAQVSEKTASVIRTALDVGEKSGGALDIGLGALSDLWSVKERTAPPAKNEIAPLLNPERGIAQSGGKITLSGGAVLDLGSVGKGAACDEAAAILKESTAKRASVSFGGSVLFFGDGEFTFGIADPEKGSAGYIATVTTGEGFISTSGTYERYFDYNSIRYHHIIDPVSGYPVQNHLVSVTVFAGGGALSDALSTACFVLGEEKGGALAGKYGAGCVFVFDDGTVKATGEIKNRIQITDDNYHLD